VLDKTHDNHRKRDDDPEKNCKRSVSFRIDEADFEKIKAIARRMRTRESDVFRFAIRMTLNKLSLLSDESIKGIDVMPVFVECGADIAVASSGIAGPDGGSSDKPVGTVWLGWAVRAHESPAIATSARCYHFDGDREAVREQSVLAGLAGLLEIINNPSSRP